MYFYTKYINSKLNHMMKKLTLLFSLFIFAWSANSQSGWQLLSTTYTNNLNDVIIVSDTVAGCVGGNSTSGQAMVTNNDGATWTTQTVSTTALNAIAISANGIWIAGDLGKIYFTTNGLTWMLQASGTTANFYDIQFPTAATGYAVGASGVIRKTTNGLSWSNPVVSGGTSNTHNAVYFTSATNGVVGGDQNSLQGYVIQSVSGASYFGTPVTTLSVINDIYFTSSTTGFAVGKAGNVFKTTNSGSSWAISNIGVSLALNAVHFSDANIGYIVGDSGTIFKTTNGGTTWAQQNSPTSQKLNSVYALDSNHVYAVGNSGTIIKTNTGGGYLTVTVADQNTNCNGFANLTAQTAYTGNGTLSYTWAASSYLSSTNTALTTAGPLQINQTFYVTVTDGTLTASDSATVFVTALNPDSICLVTVDDSLGHNVVVFEKHIQGAIHHYNIYAESSVAGSYDSIGFIPADSAGIFIDTLSDPAIKAYSYKISTIDSCGNESVMSDFHKTMHLTINQGSGTTWNLIWNHYIGVPVQTYRIWRTDTSMTWTKVDSVPGSNSSWTDLNPPTGGLYYQVEIISPYICQPYNYKANTNYNSSRSNTANNGLVGPTFSADFTSDITSGIIPLDVQFSDNSQGSPSSYFWNFGDGNTSTIANPMHTYTIAGLYTVTLRISDGTNTDSMVQVDYIDAQPVGINPAINVNNIEIYPNPLSSGQSLYINHQGLKLSTINVIDLLGKQVNYTISSSNEISEIRFNDISKGIYFISLTDEAGNRIQKKFVIR